MLTLQALACIESWRAHAKRYQGNPDTRERANNNAKPVCMIQYNYRVVGTSANCKRSEQEREFQPLRKQLLSENETRRVTTSFVSKIVWLIFQKIRSFNSVFTLLLIKITKSNVLNRQKNDQIKVYINKIETVGHDDQ